MHIFRGFLVGVAAVALVALLVLLIGLPAPARSTQILESAVALPRMTIPTAPSVTSSSPVRATTTATNASASAAAPRPPRVEYRQSDPATIRLTRTQLVGISALGLFAAVGWFLFLTRSKPRPQQPAPTDATWASEAVLIVAILLIACAIPAGLAIYTTPSRFKLAARLTVTLFASGVALLYIRSHPSEHATLGRKLQSYGATIAGPVTLEELLIP